MRKITFLFPKTFYFFCLSLAVLRLFSPPAQAEIIANENPCAALAPASGIEQTVPLLHQCFDHLINKVTAAMTADSDCRYEPSERSLLISKLRSNDNEMVEKISACSDRFQQALVCELTPAEQVFMAAVVVTWGEARGATGNYLVEYNGVRQVLENRTRILNQISPGKNYNIMNAALQENQFSLFNVDDPSWLMVIDPATTAGTIDKSIAAYLNYSSAKCVATIQNDGDAEVLDCSRLFGYYARWMDQAPYHPPAWAMNSGSLLPQATFTFDDISNVNGSKNSKIKMSSTEQKHRHWCFMVEDSTDTKNPEGVALSLINPQAHPVGVCSP
jgi:hypothetical protein